MAAGKPIGDPVLLLTAKKYLGLREVPGPGTAPTITRWLERLRLPWRDDETPWCATAVGGWLEEAGFPSTRSAAALSYLTYGFPTRRGAAVGAIAVMRRYRGKRLVGGHVGIVVGKTASGDIVLLGGNQDDAVTYRAFDPARIVAYRWPTPGGPLEERYDLPVIDVARANSET